LKRLNPEILYAMPNQGCIKTMYETLVKKLGAPHQMDGDPYAAVWWYELEDGTPFSILTYASKLPYDLHDWIVCTLSYQDYKLVREFFGLEPVE